MTARRSDDEDVDDVDGYPVRHSRRFSNELLEDARRVFQKRTDRKLSLEDARQMLENLTGYFATLIEIEQRQAKGEHLDDYGRSRRCGRGTDAFVLKAFSSLQPGQKP